MAKATLSELQLCFERFLLDARDDFFPDPFRYRDLRLLRDEIINQVRKDINQMMGQNQITYNIKSFYDWDVPKNNFVIRQGWSLHPHDLLIFHFVLNRLVPVIEPKLSTSRYSYRVKNPKSKSLFGNRPTEHWIRFKTDIQEYFRDNPDHGYLVSTDIAGFFEYIPIVTFKKQLLQMCNNQESQSVEILCHMLRKYSVSQHSGIPQNCDPFSYLCTVFLDFFDKELEASSVKLFRYVDDIKVACKTKNDAKKAIVTIIRSLRGANLNLSTAKTEIIPVPGDRYTNLFGEFPTLLSDIDDALSKKSRSKINRLAPKLVGLTLDLTRRKNYDDRLFRACIWRILRISYFRNVNRLYLDSIGRNCLHLMESAPSRTDTFLRFLVLHKDRKYLQDGLYLLLQECIYPWQEMHIWNLLIQSDTIKNAGILTLAKQRLRNNGYHEGARNFVMIFLGKHGDYQDRKYIAELFPHTQSFRAY